MYLLLELISECKTEDGQNKANEGLPPYLKNFILNQLLNALYKCLYKILKLYDFPKQIYTIRKMLFACTERHCVLIQFFWASPRDIKNLNVTLMIKKNLTPTISVLYVVFMLNLQQFLFVVRTVILNLFLTRSTFYLLKSN